MGKTAVVTALVLANPPLDATVTGAKEHLKLTLVIANNTLVRQWEQEVKKFAPNAVVHCLYQGAGSGRERAIRELRRTDVLITTPHAKWPPELDRESSSHVTIQRLVVDESHLLSGSSWKGQQLKIKNVPAKYAWCVTGTPFSGGLSDLTAQMAVLGMGPSIATVGAHIDELYQMIRGNQIASATNEQIVHRLRSVMIRHVKTQRIGGEVALALPSAECQTVWLTMSQDEKALYRLHACADGEPPWAKEGPSVRRNPVKLNELEKGLTQRRKACCHMYDDKAVGNIEGNSDPYRVEGCAAFERMHRKVTHMPGVEGGAPKVTWKVRTSKCTKYRALLADLANLHRADRTFRVVVFTSFDHVQERIVSLMRKAHEYRIFEFNQSTPPLRRHAIIDDFQNKPTDRPCVFIVTYATAAVGITLTAATRVYLMEPSVDPAAELQAAGRIHRLGQTKEIHIKRFAFRESIDEAIVGLHNKVSSGDITIVDKEVWWPSLACTLSAECSAATHRPLVDIRLVSRVTAPQFSPPRVTSTLAAAVPADGAPALYGCGRRAASRDFAI